MGTVEGSEVTLFLARISPFSQRVHLALLEKGIPFKVVDVDLVNKPKELLEANPIWKKVPTIIHNGNSLAESTVILEYLEDVWPDQVPLLPKEAGERAKMRFWCDYIYKGVWAIVETLRMKSGSPEKSAKVEEVVKFFKTVEETMAGFSAEGPFFTGNKFSLLDVMLAPAMSVKLLMKEVGEVPIPGPEETPRLHKWMETVSARPHFNVAVPTAEEEMALFKKLIEKRAAAQAAA